MTPPAQAGRKEGRIVSWWSTTRGPLLCSWATCCADARFGSLAIVMVTAENEVEYVAAAIEQGANEYIMKPFTPDNVREKLELIGVRC